MNNFSRISLLAVIGVLFAVPAWALDLQSARTQQLVGEKKDGYVEAITPSAEVNALVEDVNDKRRNEYTRISSENGQSVDVIGKLAAPQIISNLPSGALYKDGGWKEK